MKPYVKVPVYDQVRRKIIPELVGKQFGKLAVVEYLGRGCRGAGFTYWRCKCECGTAVVVPAKNLTDGNTKSCGCIASLVNRRHGAALQNNKTPEYDAWANMKSRCYSPNFIGFSHYGGRGITVCERWRNSFADFLSDVGLRPHLGWSLDRIDVNGNYEPGNVRWASKADQSRNKRNNIWLEIDGEKLVLSDAKDKFKISNGSFIRARKSGIGIAKAFVMAARIPIDGDVRHLV